MSLPRRESPAFIAAVLMLAVLVSAAFLSRGPVQTDDGPCVRAGWIVYQEGLLP